MLSDNFEEFIEELEYAYDNVPFYAKHLEAAGITPDDIVDEEDIVKIPTSIKRDFRKNFPMKTFAKGFNIKDPALVRSQSSGTSGERLITFEVGMLLSSRAMDCVEVNPVIEEAFSRTPRRICRFAPPNCSDVECANPNSTMEDRMLSDGTLVLPVYHDLLTTSEKMLRRAIEEIHLHKPDLYYVDPTHFAFLLRQAKAFGLEVPYAPIITTYSVLSPLIRRQIRQYFADIDDESFALSQLVSSSEMGWVALECQHGHLHLNSDAFYMEILADGEQVELGESGDLCISSIDNGAVPHIRYCTGDEFKYVADECECGYHTPVVEMLGRRSDFIQAQDGRMLAAAEVCAVVDAPDWLDMYQLRQLDVNRFTLLTIVNAQYQGGDEQTVLSAVQQLIGENVKIEWQNVTYIATERSGKFHIVKNEMSD